MDICEDHYFVYHQTTIIHFVIQIIRHFASGAPLSSCILCHISHHSYNTSLFSGILRCYRLIFHFSISSLGSNCFSKEAWVLLLENDILKPRSRLWVPCISCVIKITLFLNIKELKKKKRFTIPLCADLQNTCKSLCVYICISTHTDIQTNIYQ